MIDLTIFLAGKISSFKYLRVFNVLYFCLEAIGPWTCPAFGKKCKLCSYRSVHMYGHVRAYD